MNRDGSSILITGSRGIPARHGGFETLVQNLAPYLANRGWDVTVYCQESGRGAMWEDTWRGVRLVHIPSVLKNPYGSILFDMLSLLDAARRRGIILTLGYNTAIFNVFVRMLRRFNVIHMDGIEWKRAKWNGLLRLWFKFNERLAVKAGNVLIADHPEISARLSGINSGSDIAELFYGADFLRDVDASPLARFGLEPGRYCLVIARPEPENSILEIVRAYSARQRGAPLVVLGDYSDNRTPYTEAVLEHAGDEVLFPGPVYEKPVLDALRYHCRCYLHGHTVGGTNPSLVEAMGASNFIIANDNRFNRWVTGNDGALFFSTLHDLEEKITLLFSDSLNESAMKQACIDRFRKNFTWAIVLSQYEEFLRCCLNKSGLNCRKL